MAPRPSNEILKGDTRREIQYVVKVNVLGIAGITVDRPKCRDVSNSDRAPGPPKHMTAVVSILHNSEMQGCTAMSSELKRSPQDSVIIRAQGADGEEEEVPMTSSTNSEHRIQRHVAVWSADDAPDQESAVYFETTLARQDSAKSAASFALARKNFDLIVGLSDGTSDAEKRFALPIGAANLAISADHPQGLVATMDLPVYPLTLSASNSQDYCAIPMDAEERNMPKKKRAGLARVFARKSQTDLRETNFAVGDDEKESFATTYAVDSNGDALLRVEVEVWEKGSTPSVQSRTSRSSTKFSKSNSVTTKHSRSASTKAATSVVSKHSRTSTKASKSTKGSKDSSVLLNPVPFWKRPTLNKSRSQLAKKKNLATSQAAELRKVRSIPRVQPHGETEAVLSTDEESLLGKGVFVPLLIADISFPSPATSIVASAPVAATPVFGEAIERVYSNEDEDGKFVAFPGSVGGNFEASMKNQTSVKQAPPRTVKNKASMAAVFKPVALKAEPPKPTRRQTPAPTPTEVPSNFRSSKLGTPQSSPKGPAQAFPHSDETPKRATNSSGLYSTPLEDQAPLPGSPPKSGAPFSWKSKASGVSADAMLSKAKTLVAKARSRDDKSLGLISPPSVAKNSPPRGKKSQSRVKGTDGGSAEEKFMVLPAEPNTSEMNQGIIDAGDDVQDERPAPGNEPKKLPGPRVAAVGRILSRLNLPTCGMMEGTGDNSVADDDHTFASLNIMGRRLRIPECGGGGDDETWAKFDEDTWDDTKAKDEISWLKQPEEVLRQGLCRPSRAPSEDAHSRRVNRWKQTLNTSELGTFEEEDTKGNSYEDGTFDDTLDNTLAETLEDGTMDDTFEDESSVDDDSFSRESGVVDTDGKTTPGVDNRTRSQDKALVHVEGQIAEPLAVTDTFVPDLYPGDEGKYTPRRLSRGSKDESPKGVADYMDFHPKNEAKPTISQTLMGMLTCRTSISREDLFDEGRGKRAVPRVLIPSDADDSSVGELTATTHEMRVDIESFKQKLVKTSATSSERKKILPMRKVSELLRCPAPKPEHDDDTLHSDSTPAKNENYFEEYDDYSFLSPEMAAAAEAARTRRKAGGNTQVS